MGRPVMLGNGGLTVGIGKHGLVHDFYYPFVGLDNLTTSRNLCHLVGVWVDGQFSWTNDHSWVVSIDFETDAMVGDISMTNERLGIELVFTDFVDSELDAFCRIVRVINKASNDREIRVFMHQIFQISRAGRADTALFVPEDNYILDYKGHCSLLIYGQTEDGKPFDQYAIGNYGIEGKEGTFRDAEDGELSGNAVEHGGVDSVIRFVCQTPAGGESKIDYWVVATDSHIEGDKTLAQIKKEGAKARLDNTRAYWRKWLSTAADGIKPLGSKYADMVKKSLMIIKVHTDKRGGVIASCDSSIYNYGRDYYSYVWPRDGAYAIWPLIRLGYTEEPKKFFEFCRDIITPSGYLMHKYQPDRTVGSTWHPLIHNNRRELAIQEDETAIVVYMLGEYLKQSGDREFVKSLYDSFIQPAANFMTSFIDKQTNLPHASYDLWEKQFLTSTYTTATVYGALIAAADMADQLEYPYDVNNWRKAAASILKSSDALFDTDRKSYIKGYLLMPDDSKEVDNMIDISSLYGPFMFGMNKKVTPIKQTQQAVEEFILDKSPSGGTPRHEHDDYFQSKGEYQGNPWPVATLWMSQYYMQNGQADKAKGYIDWVIDHALPSGALSEQIDPEDGSPISVTPLVWSHAELIRTILDVQPKD